MLIESERGFSCAPLGPLHRKMSNHIGHMGTSYEILCRVRLGGCWTQMIFHKIYSDGFLHVFSVPIFGLLDS